MPRVTHGLSRGANRHPLYRVWKGMRARCNSPSDGSYARYGGRGVTVCDRWSGPDGFLNFLADMGPRPDGYSLDRTDNEGPYSPENCRWATRKTQQANRRPAPAPNRRLDERQVQVIRHDIATHTQAELAARFGVAQTTISAIVRRVTWGDVPDSPPTNGKDFKS
jgi:hypothetical protein